MSSAAFKDSEASVDRGNYRSVEESLENYSNYGLARVLAGDARSLEQEVVADPELLNPAHALIRGKKSRAIARRLAGRAVWVRQLAVTAAPESNDE